MDGCRSKKIKISVTIFVKLRLFQGVKIYSALKRVYKILIFFLILLITGVALGYVIINKTFDHTNQVRQEEAKEVLVSLR
ncbi:MAG: hypothetical protein CO119_08200 [Flavobacteriales bacterium CG_4_9_14_3_um_filter_40_17]|nr:MAG: hypothetical protein CO119_08200 [Flavobacteriales bacterium CG_4_9_14_3_um_filter_40_17]